MISDEQWRTIKAMLDGGWKATDIAKRIPNVTAQQIYYRKRVEKQLKASKNPVYHTLAYAAWRRAVLKRYDYKCVVCKTKGSKSNPLQCDHMWPQSTHPELRYKVSNGRVLCLRHHRQTSTWGKGALKYAGKGK